MKRTVRRHLGVLAILCLLTAPVWAQQGEDGGGFEPAPAPTDAPAAEPTDEQTPTVTDGETTDEPDSEKSPTTRPAQKNPFGDYFIFIMIGGFLLLYLFMSRSRKKQEKKRKELLASLKKGDKVITIGGIVGTIVEARETEVVLKVNDNNRMTMARWAIRTAGDDVQDDKKKETQEQQQ